MTELKVWNAMPSSPIVVGEGQHLIADSQHVDERIVTDVLHDPRGA